MTAHFNNSKRCFKINPYPNAQNKNIHFYNTDENTNVLKGDFTIHCKIKCVAYNGYYFIPFGSYSISPNPNNWLGTIFRDQEHDQLPTVWKYYSNSNDSEYVTGRILITDRQANIYDANDIIICRKDGTIYYFLNGIMIGSRKSRWTTLDFSFGDFTTGGLWSNDGTQHGNFFCR